MESRVSTRIRLDRALAERGVQSRNEAKKAVRAGLVKVGGALAQSADLLIEPDADIEFDGEPLLAVPAWVVFHKPVGMLSTEADPWGRLTLASAIPEPWRARLHPVGRLDLDTSGLLLFSSDGTWTQRALHPRRAVEREYVATTEPAPDAELAPKLAAGVGTAEGVVRAQVRSIAGTEVQLIVTEGKYRMVRRMLANAGHPVVALRRVRFGGFLLEDLPAGAWRLPTDGERDWAQSLLTKT
jgi:pseudouridine synthase